MRIECEMAKLNPTTKVKLELAPGQLTETETNFVVPIVLPTVDGKQILVAAIKCELSEIKDGVQKISVSSAVYTNGELSEFSLLNYVQVDLKQFVSPTDENEIVLSVTTVPASANKKPE